MESPWRLTGSIRLRLSTWNECPRVILKILSLPSSLVFWHHHPVTEHGNWTNPSFSSMNFPARNFHIYNFIGFPSQPSLISGGSYCQKSHQKWVHPPWQTPKLAVAGMSGKFPGAVGGLNPWNAVIFVSFKPHSVASISISIISGVH